MDANYAKIRMAALAASLGLGVLYITSMALEPYRDLPSTVLAMAASIVYVLVRAAGGTSRRDAMDAWLRYGRTPFAASPYIRIVLRAAFAWAASDAMWIAMDLSAYLSWGVPGVMASLFQLLFLAGFRAAPEMRPDLYADEEHAQSTDMLEGLLYAQACAAVGIYAWISSGGL